VVRRVTANELVDMIARRGRDEVVDAVVAVGRRDGFDAVVALLGEVQREVGARWENRSWTIADEHAATATVDVALAAAALEVPDATDPLGAVIVACAEEEWHLLAARMVAEQLRSRRWNVTFLGPSTPVDHLTAYLSRRRPVALAVSCSVPIHLPGARRTVAAGHTAGVPVIVGGAALGSSERRARAIGADGWASDVAGAHSILAEWADVAPPLAEPADDSDQRLLHAHRAGCVEDALTTVSAEFPPFATYTPAQRATTREDFDSILRSVEAALLTRDDNIVIDFAEWLTHVVRADGLPPGHVPLGARCLLSAIPPGHEAARRLLELMAASAARAE
jgi:methanogenic corrinoid protein MtbC1